MKVWKTVGSCAKCFNCKDHAGISEIVSVYNLKTLKLEMINLNHKDQIARDWKNKYQECIFEEWGY